MAQNSSSSHPKACLSLQPCGPGSWVSQAVPMRRCHKQHAVVAEPRGLGCHPSAPTPGRWPGEPCLAGEEEDTGVFVTRSLQVREGKWPTRHGSPRVTVSSETPQPRASLTENNQLCSTAPPDPAAKAPPPRRALLRTGRENGGDAGGRLPEARARARREGARRPAEAHPGRRGARRGGARPGRAGPGRAERGAGRGGAGPGRAGGGPRRCRRVPQRGRARLPPEPSLLPLRCQRRPGCHIGTAAPRRRLPERSGSPARLEMEPRCRRCFCCCRRRCRPPGLALRQGRRCLCRDGERGAAV